DSNPAMAASSPGQVVSLAQLGDRQGAQVFLQANESKPENLAASASRLFLGVKLECAQCHDHPFARWSRKQFWELAAFFPDLQQPQRGQPAPQPVRASSSG